MDSHRERLTELTLTKKATGQLPNSGCTSSLGSPNRSLIDNSKSSFSVLTWRRLRSRSADPVHDGREKEIQVDTISEAIDRHRRRFLGATAVAVAAAQLGRMGSAAAQTGETKAARLPA